MGRSTGIALWGREGEEGIRTRGGEGHTEVRNRVFGRGYRERDFGRQKCGIMLWDSVQRESDRVERKSPSPSLFITMPV